MTGTVDLPLVAADQPIPNLFSAPVSKPPTKTILSRRHTFVSVEGSGVLPRMEFAMPGNVVVLASDVKIPVGAPFVVGDVVVGHVMRSDGDGHCVVSLSQPLEVTGNRSNDERLKLARERLSFQATPRIEML